MGNPGRCLGEGFPWETCSAVRGKADPPPVVRERLTIRREVRSCCSRCPGIPTHRVSATAARVPNESRRSRGGAPCSSCNARLRPRSPMQSPPGHTTMGQGADAGAARRLSGVSGHAARCTHDRGVDLPAAVDFDGERTAEEGRLQVDPAAESPLERSWPLALAPLCPCGRKGRA